MSLEGETIWDVPSAIRASNFLTKEITVSCAEVNAGSGNDDSQAELAMSTP